MLMDTVTIRNQIQRARRHEALTCELALLIQARVNRLHSTLCVRGAEPHIQLLSFIHAFVNRTPDLLDTLEEISRNRPWEELSETLCDICIGFFTSPPPLLKGHNGMNGAMAKAYLCHRIIEEMNDCYRVSCQVPLLPVDFTTANLIIHQLIGEPLGNLLDNLIHTIASRLYDGVAFNGYAQVDCNNTEAMLAVCRRRALLDEALHQTVIISSAFPGGTIH